uniref:Uncharacterized protein n=1 Tax=Ixodes ricinus TaxID=34613 RepID=A0A6B0UCK5_IXORI
MKALLPLCCNATSSVPPAALLGAWGSELPWRGGPDPRMCCSRLPRGKSRCSRQRPRTVAGSLTFLEPISPASLSAAFACISAALCAPQLEPFQSFLCGAEQPIWFLHA